MPSTVTVHHPAGVIDLGHGLEIDAPLLRQALGALLHARVPVYAGKGAKRKQAGTAVLITWRNMPDGSAVDLEFELDLEQ